MPSYARQGATVIRRKDRKNKGNTILISRKTGFMDVWVNGQHFYYNYKKYGVDPSKINWDEMQRQARDMGKKGVIVIRSK